jgi:hypothetical protein
VNFTSSLLYIYKEVQLKSKLQQMEPDRPQRDRRAACVIAQQYSSATFVSMRFHSCKENFGSRLKKCYVSCFTGIKIL